MHVYLVWKLRHDDVWGNQLEHRWFIASEVCVEDNPHDLHIRLRHRYSSSRGSIREDCQLS